MRIQLEDQVFPKMCGHTPTVELSPSKTQFIIESLFPRVITASLPHCCCENRRAHWSRASTQALRRADRFLEAGPNVIFIEKSESTEDMRRIGDI